MLVRGQSTPITYASSTDGIDNNSVIREDMQIPWPSTRHSFASSPLRIPAALRIPLLPICRLVSSSNVRRHEEHIGSEEGCISRHATKGTVGYGTITVRRDVMRSGRHMAVAHGLLLDIAMEEARNSSDTKSHAEEGDHI